MIMNKKILFFISFLFLSSAMFAQSMSDDQVLKFIKTEQAKGTNQQTIVTKLMRRGVTTQQLQRVRKKYQQQQQQMGAVDAVDRVKDDDRMRLDVEKGSFGSENNRFMTTMERREAMNEELMGFGVDSVMTTEGADPYEVFGRNIFNNQFLTFQPNTNMATPQNYRLGAGDKVIIDVWGASQESFSATISPDGTVVIPGIGPIRIGGLSVGEATNKVRGVLGARYSSSQISLSLGETRSIMVQVMVPIRSVHSQLPSTLFMQQAVSTILVHYVTLRSIVTVVSLLTSMCMTISSTVTLLEMFACKTTISFGLAHTTVSFRHVVV